MQPFRRHPRPSGPDGAGRPVLLRPDRPVEDVEENPRWRVIVNETMLKTKNRARDPKMMLLRCTAKVLKLLEQQPREVELSQFQTSPREWYVNFVDEFGPTFALCVNPLSLYTLVLSADHLDGVGDLAGRLLSRLTLHMVELGIDQPRVKRLAQECSSVLVAKTASRSVLGSMNDLINHFCWHFSRHISEKGKADLWAIEQQLNNMPQRPIGWKYAQEQFIELCSKL